MRLILVGLLLQGCVASSIELGEENVDAGPSVDVGPREDTVVVVDAAGPDANADVPVDYDAGCSTAVPFELPCFDGCEKVPIGADTFCACSPAPPRCFRDCNDNSQCTLSYECCVGADCPLVALNVEGGEIYSDFCGESPALGDAIARCVMNQCEVIQFSDCSDGSACVVVVANDTLGCGGNVAITEARVGEYKEFVCPEDGEMPVCCADLGENLRPALCEDGRCVLP